MATIPTVLIVDDEPDLQRQRLQVLEAELTGLRFDVAFPDDLTVEQLSNADLVLVDYRLDHWAGTASASGPCRSVPNGIALAAVLQQHAGSFDHPVAFAIHSEHLRELTDPFPPEPRVHLLARTYNLEWAFVKSPEGGPKVTLTRAGILATAVKQLPKKWPEDAVAIRQAVRSLLGLSDGESWAETAWQDVEAARPPLDELVLRVHGLLFLRWLLSRVLSYPTFLMNRHWLAARLGATPQSVDAALSGGLGEWLAPIRYRGILADFRGRRWWRAGLELFLWKVSGGRSVAQSELLEILSATCGSRLDPTPVPLPVVCLDENYIPIEDLSPPSQAVRLQLDDWPAHAEQAWTTIERAGATRLGGLVIESDQYRLEQA